MAEKQTFFYRNWWLFYLLFFLLLGLLIYALLWRPFAEPDKRRIDDLQTKNAQLIKDLENCRNKPEQPAAVLPPELDSTAVVNCNATVKAGGEGSTTTQHTLGENPGRIVVLYNMQNIPDQLTVYYNNKIVASTGGQVSGEGQLEFNYNPAAGGPDFCVVEVSAPQENTAWEYLLNCPQ